MGSHRLTEMYSAEERRCSKELSTRPSGCQANKAEAELCLLQAHQLDRRSFKGNNASRSGSGIQRGLQPEVAVSAPLTPRHRRFVRAVVSSRVFKIQPQEREHVPRNSIFGSNTRCTYPRF